MSDPPAAARLDRFGIVLVSGPDARTFLQGQLSFDMDGLTAARMELASLNSAQGRVQAVLWLIERNDAIVLLTNAVMVDAVIARLRKYVLRAKVTMERGDERLTALLPHNAVAAPDPERGHTERNEVSLIRWPGTGGEARVLMLAPAPAAAHCDPVLSSAWHLADLQAGLPQIHPATHEAFVAQMLNLDVLGGIGFEKGCYTGQEIIARTHFRGSVKRRMLRFAASCAPPAPGARIVSAGSHAGDVVDAAATAQGCELLAVISVGQKAAVLELETTPGVQLQLLPLPYAL